jgi:hypothetical protein
MGKDMIRNFWSGFISVFRLGRTSMKHMEPTDIDKDFILSNQDINKTFNKIKAENEG